ncbi:MAG: class I SAM-dependent methyltransferase [Candidatus Aenigmarchaeota archaeon]|nr:class I SAM-dependent methyltransferase [Candidatus Aenigmarchaeota archaeon]
MAWSEIWKSVEDARFRGETYRWFFYKTLFGNYDFRNKRVLEIGCGTGINSVLMAKAGAHVTLLDSSREALSIAKKLLDKFSLDGELVCENAFRHMFRDEFDLVHSEGVIEHFTGEYRQEIVDAHSVAAKAGGMVLIIAPNMKCPPYRIGKFLAEKTGTWIYGNEYPYSKKELVFRMEKSGLSIQKIQGAEFAFAPGWVLSPVWQKSPRLLKKSLSTSANRSVVRLNYGKHFLNEWGVVIGAVGKKL